MDMYMYYVHTSRVDKFYDIIHLLVHRARQAPDKLQHWLAAGEHVPRPAPRQGGESSVEQGHHGHRHRTTDGAVQGFHGDRGWTEGTCEEPDEVWVFCRYTGIKIHWCISQYMIDVTLSKKQTELMYCGFIRFRDDSIFVEFMGS